MALIFLDVFSSLTEYLFFPLLSPSHPSLPHASSPCLPAHPQAHTSSPCQVAKPMPQAHASLPQPSPSSVLQAQTPLPSLISSPCIPADAAGRAEMCVRPGRLQEVGVNPDSILKPLIISWDQEPMGPWAQGPWPKGPWAQCPWVQGPRPMGPWANGSAKELFHGGFYGKRGMGTK